MLQPLRVLALLALTALGVPAQQVLVVDAANGPGSDFSALQPAIDAASHGDILLMKAGTYAKAVLLGKALTIVAEDQASVQLTGRLRLVGTPIGSTTTVKGLTITGTPGLGQAALHAKTCHGTLWLESCTFTGSASDGANSGVGADIESCGDVVLVRCTVTGGSAQGDHAGGRTALLATDSSLWAFESDFAGTDGNSSGNDIVGFPGGHGALLADGSTLFATACAFTGGDGGDAEEKWDEFCGCSICGSAGDGGSGVHLDDSMLTEQDCTFAPGFAGLAFGGECDPGSSGLDVALTAASTSTPLPGSTRGLRMSTVVREGESAQFAAFGLPGELVWWLAGFDAASLDLPGKNSALLLQLPILLSLPVAPVPASGVLVVDFAAPELPVGLEGVLLRNQAFFAGTGNGQLSNAASTVFVDASF